MSDSGAGLTVTVKYLSALRDRAGQREDAISFLDGTSLGDVLQWLARQHGIAIPDAQVMLTLNGRGLGQLAAGPSTPIADGDVICLFPVISGG